MENCHNPRKEVKRDDWCPHQEDAPEDTADAPEDTAKKENQ